MIEQNGELKLDYHFDSRVIEADDKLIHYYCKMMNPGFDESSDEDKAAILNEVMRLSIARLRRDIRNEEDLDRMWRVV